MGEHVVEGRVGRRGGDRVAAEGGDPVAADAVEQVAATDDAADREPVGEALGKRHEVRGDAVRLDAPEGLACAAPAGLHLVGDEEDAVGVEDFLVGREEPVGGHGEAADALDRLGDERADVGGVDRGAQQRAQVRDAGLDELCVRQVAVGGQLLPVRAMQVVSTERVVAARLPASVARDGDGAEGPAVVRAPHREDLVGLAGAEGGGEGGLVGLGAGIGEEHLGIGDARDLGDLLGELDLAADQVERGGVVDPGRDLPLHRLADLSHVVAEHVRENAGEEVEVAVALAVVDAAALAADDLDRLAVVDTDPGWDDRTVAGEEIRHSLSLPLVGRAG